MSITKGRCVYCGDIYEIGMSFCPYCGRTIIPTDESTKTININKNININKRYEDVAESEKVDSKERIEMEKLRQKEKDKKRSAIGTALGIFLPFLLMFVIFGISFGAAKHNSNLEEERLEILVEEVMTDIKNGNYDSAYIKANKIHYTEDWSSEIEENGIKYENHYLKK